jgi:hypothetical protein
VAQIGVTLFSTRPHGWWLYDAPEPLRRKISGDTPTSKLLFTAHGVPLHWPAPPNPPVYESERDYLSRHGLLTADEMKI